MKTEDIVLKDAEEIEQFFVETTGMKPGYLQLSAGSVGLRSRVVELAGVTLVWSTAQGRARWRDEMTGDGLHVGFAVESSGPILSRGRAVEADEAQVWMPGKEMDLILVGPNLTLDVGVEAGLVEELGWEFGGDPLKKVSRKALTRLLRTCRAATTTANNSVRGTKASNAFLKSQQWRDQVLDELEPVLLPWFPDSERQGSTPAPAAPYYSLVSRADDFFDGMDTGAHFKVDRLVESLGVPRRTVFHAYRKVLGVGPRRYFELKRLHIMRSRLRRASSSETTVTRIATDLGFGDMGRLAGHYKSHFGESPSQTLRRR